MLPPGHLQSGGNTGGELIPTHCGVRDAAAKFEAVALDIRCMADGARGTAASCRYCPPLVAHHGVISREPEWASAPNRPGAHRHGPHLFWHEGGGLARGVRPASSSAPLVDSADVVNASRWESDRANARRFVERPGPCTHSMMFAPTGCGSL